MMEGLCFYSSKYRVTKGFKFHAQPQTGAYSCCSYSELKGKLLKSYNLRPNIASRLTVPPTGFTSNHMVITSPHRTSALFLIEVTDPFPSPPSRPAAGAPCLLLITVNPGGCKDGGFWAFPLPWALSPLPSPPSPPFPL